MCVRAEVCGCVCECVTFTLLPFVTCHPTATRPGKSSFTDSGTHPSGTVFSLFSPGLCFVFFCLFSDNVFTSSPRPLSHPQPQPHSFSLVAAEGEHQRRHVLVGSSVTDVGIFSVPLTNDLLCAGLPDQQHHLGLPVLLFGDSLIT